MCLRHIFFIAFFFHVFIHVGIKEAAVAPAPAAELRPERRREQRGEPGDGGRRAQPRLAKRAPSSVGGTTSGACGVPYAHPDAAACGAPPMPVEMPIW